MNYDVSAVWTFEATRCAGFWQTTKFKQNLTKMMTQKNNFQPSLWGRRRPCIADLMAGCGGRSTSVGVGRCWRGRLRYHLCRGTADAAIINASVPVGPTVPSLLPPLSSEFLTPDSSDPQRQERQQFRPWFQGTNLRCERGARATTCIRTFGTIFWLPASHKKTEKKIRQVENKRWQSVRTSYM